jgi:rifampicin phosphotransferase
MAGAGETTMNETTLILSFDEAEPRLDLTGGKGLNLIHLTRAGMPVPPGFVVTTNAYQTFVQANHLDERIGTALAAASNGLPIAAASADIRAAFEAGQFPEELEGQIAAAYVDLCVQTHQVVLAVAVRSSATSEDLAEASFAGQQDTYLNVSGQLALLEAIKRCFGSLWSERAIASRARRGVPPQWVRRAGVFQQMVFANAAGVAFTAEPLSGDSNQIVIDATWGLGESLVSGLVTPDHIVVDKRNGAIVSQTTANKTVMIVPTPQGTAEQPVPPSRQRARVLTTAQLRQLAELCRQIEGVYGRPLDLEWCLAGGRLYILQARPITTLPDVPITWDPPGAGQWLHGGGSFEMMTEPISPLFETFLLPIFAQTIVQMMEGLGLKGILPQVPFQVVNGHIYLHMDLRLRPRHLAGVLRDFLLHLNSMQEQQSEQERYRCAVRDLTQLPVAGLSGADILARMDALGQAAMRYWLQIMKLVQVIYRQERAFMNEYRRRVRRPDDVEAEVFLRGQVIRPWEAERSSYDLAALARGLDGVPAILQSNLDGAVARLRESPAGREFLAILDVHLARYGHQIASFDLRLPTLADDPRPVLAEVQAYLHGKESPIERRQRMAQERDRATAGALARLAPRARQRFNHLLTTAQAAARTREDALFDVGLAWTDMHRAALELGRRFVDAGVVHAAEDIFWLRLDEVRAVVAALDAGQAPEPLSSAAGERQRLNEAWSRVQAPYLLPRNSKPAFWWHWIFPTPELQRHPDAHTLVGLGVSPGKVTATARVLRSLDEMDALQPGEILVTHTTTPAWTPLFARAAGLVTDLGGPLAHGSIVAREYGIPAVMGTGNATQKIKSGQTITLFGSEGKVKLD